MRTETRTASMSTAPRGGSRAAAAGCLIGAVCLILSVSAAMSQTATEPASPAPAAAKPQATPATTRPASKVVPPATAATASKPATTTTAVSKAPATVANAGKPVPVTVSPVVAGRNPATPGARTPAAEGSRASLDSIPGAPGAKPNAVTARPGTATAARPARASVTPAGPTPARLAASSAGKPHGVQTVAHLDQKLTYQYNALGRRDPFQPMIGGEFVGADVGGDAPVDVGGMKVVGIVWGTEDKFAMVEDGRGQSMVLRVGDKVMNGVVEGLRRDAVVVRITTDGQTQSVAIPLTRKGDKTNATR
jgi:hypothetical protein